MAPLEERPPVEVDNFGLVVFFVSLAILFASTIIGFLIVDQGDTDWLPPGAWIRVGLGASTAALLASGVLLQLALVRVRRDDVASLPRLITAAHVLAWIFLVLQVVNWFQVYEVRQPSPTGAVPHAFFYMLSGLHALHVLGGYVPLGIVNRRAYLGLYSAREHRGLLHCTMYWHFLDGVWLTTLATVLLVG